MGRPCLKISPCDNFDKSMPYFQSEDLGSLSVGGVKLVKQRRLVSFCTRVGAQCDERRR